MNGSEGHLYKSKIKPEVAVYLDEHYPGFFEEMLRLAKSLVAFYGETTADGAGDGSTLICSDLADKPDFDGNQVVILSGDYDGQARDINGATTGGTVTPHLAFGGQIVTGTEFVILAVRTTPTEVAAIEAKLDSGTHGLAALKALIDAVEAKLEVEPLSKESGTTTIEAAADFTALQTVIEDTNTDVRHIGDIFIDLNMNGDASAFHNRATPGDILTFQIEVSFDGSVYEYVDSGIVTASATEKVGIIIKDFWVYSKWRVRMRVDNDRGEYKFRWMYGG